MLGVIGSLAGLIKIKSSQTLVDDSIFRLHYRWTTSLCFIACGLVSTSDLVGNPIQCLMGGEEAPKPITTYCWVSSTFTINTNNADGSLGVHEEGGENRLTGLGLYDSDKHEKRVHGYYQWVPFVLFIMGCLFYLPHLIWKQMEGKKIESMLQGLNVVSFDEANDKKRDNLVRYMIESQRQLNALYAYGYFFVQLLNLFIALGILFSLDEFFEDVFMNYGIQVIFYLYTGGYMEIDYNPMLYAFPRLAKCTFRMFGPSGTPEEHDALCLLPQNIMNEKIFLVIWVWIFFLITLTAANIIFLAIQLISPYLRLKIIEQHGKLVSSEDLEKYLLSIDLGDYFLLVNVAKNLDGISFKDVLEKLIQKTKSVEPSTAASLELTPGSVFSPHAPSYTHFNNLEDEDPVDFKRRMAAAAAAGADGYAADGYAADGYAADGRYGVADTGV